MGVRGLHWRRRGRVRCGWFLGSKVIAIKVDGWFTLACVCSFLGFNSGSFAEGRLIGGFPGCP